MLKKLLLSLIILSPSLHAAALSQDDANKAFRQAIFEFDLDKVQASVAAGADVNYNFDSGTEPSALGYLFGWAGKNPADAARRPAIIAYLCKQNIQMPTRNDNNKTLLHIAAECGDHESLTSLLKKLPSHVNTLDFRQSYAPLHYAAQSGNVEAVKVLLNAGAQVDLIEKNDFGWNFKETPLHIAAKNGHTACAQLLIQRGAKVAKKNSARQTPLILAAKNNHLECLKLLLKAPKVALHTSDQHNKDILTYAIENKNPEMVQTILAHNKLQDPGTRILLSSSYLNAAIHAKSPECLDILLAKETGINATETGDNPRYTMSLEYPIVCSTRAQDPIYAEKLLAAGVLLGDFHLFDALAKHEDVSSEIMRFFLDKAKQGNESNFFAKHTDNGFTLLHGAAKRGDHAAVAELIRMGANVNAKTVNSPTALVKKKETPLHFAAKKGSPESIRHLLDAHADIEAADYAGKRALHYAIGDRYSQNTSTDALELLIERGADIEAVDTLGMSPLLYAAENGKTEAFILLANNNANVDAKTALGKTALELLMNRHQYDSASKDLPACIEVLAQKSSDPDFQKKALELACAKGHTNVIKALIEKDITVDAQALAFLDDKTKEAFTRAQADRASYLAEQERLKREQEEREKEQARLKKEAEERAQKEAEAQRLAAAAAAAQAQQRQQAAQTPLPAPSSASQNTAPQQPGTSPAPSNILPQTPPPTAGNTPTSQPTSTPPTPAPTSQGPTTDKSFIQKWGSKGLIGGGFVGSCAVLWNVLKAAQKLVDQKIVRTNHVRTQAGQEPITLEGNAYAKEVLQKTLHLLARKDRAKAIALLASLTAVGTGIYLEVAAE